MLKLKNLQTKALALATTAGATLYGAASFAQETGSLTVPSTGVNASEIGTKLGEAVGPFLLAGVGVAIAVFIVRAGWNWIKSLGRG